MNKKENKGGELTNEQLEQDLRVKGNKDNEGGYRGMQDTGDDGIRSMGTDVQKRDGQEDEQNND